MGHYDEQRESYELAGVKAEANKRNMTVEEYWQWSKDIEQFNRGKEIARRKTRDIEDLDFYHSRMYDKKMQLGYIKE